MEEKSAEGSWKYGTVFDTWAHVAGTELRVEKHKEQLLDLYLSPNFGIKPGEWNRAIKFL